MRFLKRVYYKGIISVQGLRPIVEDQWLLKTASTYRTLAPFSLRRIYLFSMLSHYIRLSHSING